MKHKIFITVPSLHMCSECPLESPVAIQTHATTTTVPMFANVLWHIIRANSFNEGVCRWQLHLGQTCLPHPSWQRNVNTLHARTRGRCQQLCQQFAKPFAENSEEDSAASFARNFVLLPTHGLCTRSKYMMNIPLT